MRRVLAVVFALVLAFFASGVSAQQGQWQSRLSLRSGDFYSTVFISKSVVLAGGPGGILRSGDAGRSWSWATNESVGDIDAAGDGLHAWAVSGRGRILATADGGRTWAAQQSGTDLGLSDVAAFDAQTALVVGVRSSNSDVGFIQKPPDILLRTDDGGRTWHEVPFPEQHLPGRLTVERGGDRAWLTAQLCTPDSEAPGMCRWSLSFFRSDDRGQSWAEIGDGRYLWSVSFADASVGWALESRTEAGQLFARNLLVRTEDGGVTWRVVRDCTTEGGSPGGFILFDERTLLLPEREISGDKTRLLRTKDAGLTWTQVGQPDVDYLLSPAYWDESHGVRTGPLRWTEDGVNWQEAVTPIFAGRSTIFDFVDSLNGWVSGASLLRTRDGGFSWEVISDLQPIELDFVSPLEGWAIQSGCGRSGYGWYCVLHTSDGGITWEKQLDFFSGGSMKISFLDALDGWVQRDQGYPLLRTRDGGRTWQERQTPGETLAFAGPELVWAAKGQPTADGQKIVSVYRSEDGGESWLPAGSLEDPEGCGPTAVEAFDARRAWVVTEECIHRVSPVLHWTADGGANWERLPLGGVGWVQVLSFFSERDGVAVRSVCSETDINVPCEDVLMRTNDGGLTWGSEPTGFQGFGFHRYVFFDPWRGWFLGGEGVYGVQNVTLYGYSGSPPAVPQKQVGMPDVGQGHEGGSAPPVIVVLGVLGVFLVGLGCLRSLRPRHLRRPR